MSQAWHYWGSLKCFIRLVWHTKPGGDMDVPVVWTRNKEHKLTLAPPGMCLSRLWVSGWVWIYYQKKKVYISQMVYPLQHWGGQCFPRSWKLITANTRSHGFKEKHVKDLQHETNCPSSLGPSGRLFGRSCLVKFPRFVFLWIVQCFACWLCAETHDVVLKPAMHETK